MTKPKPKPKPKRMSKKEYLEALDNLGLTVASKATVEALGLSIRQVQRLSSGDVKVPRPVEKLLRMYLRHGLDDEEA